MSSWSASRSAWSSAERWAGATRLLPTCGYVLFTLTSPRARGPRRERPDMLHLRRESPSQIPQKINMIHRSKVISREHVPAKLLDDTVLRVAVGAKGGCPRPGRSRKCQGRAPGARADRGCPRRARRPAGRAPPRCRAARARSDSAMLYLPDTRVVKQRNRCSPARICCASMHSRLARTRSKERRRDSPTKRSRGLAPQHRRRKPDARKPRSTPET